MCGRYILAPKDNLISRYDLTHTDFTFKENYNISPSQILPVITYANQYKLIPMKWGLTPKWMQQKLGPINARSETILQKPMFASLFSKHRCLIPASGFYEWQKTEKNTIPYYIFPKHNEIISFAGLYDAFIDNLGNTHYSYAIITTKPNNIVSPIHDRMPVILSPGEELLYLTASLHKAFTLLDPYQDTELQAYPISKRINSPLANDASLLTQYSYSNTPS